MLQPHRGILSFPSPTTGLKVQGRGDGSPPKLQALTSREASGIVDLTPDLSFLSYMVRIRLLIFSGLQLVHLQNQGANKNP